MQAKDYARAEARESWLRHPALGDPSFDSFVHAESAVHVSAPPYEWAVNGSLFCDPKDGAWYLYGGLYPEGYQRDDDAKSRIEIYRSRDRGASWESLGDPFAPGFRFDGLDDPADAHPDCVIEYDPETDLYWMAYDYSTDHFTWEFANVGAPEFDSGAALAWARSPAGPFTRLNLPAIRNNRLRGKLGRYNRLYASTLLKRKNDWLLLALCDSKEHFAWALACLTAETPEGPWSEPHIVLSVDVPGYYPTPVEFHPCFVQEGVVYAPATSVCLNREYQALHCAPLEAAQDPAAWRLVGDGGQWHAEPHEYEAHGIWGQTFHGFVRDAVFHVMFPSRNSRGLGTLSTAQRPWDRPYTDGFVFSAQEGAAIAPLLCAYGDFSLACELEFRGTVELGFDYRGVLGPAWNGSDTPPSPEALRGYTALRLCDGQAALVRIDQQGREQVFFSREARATRFTLRRAGGRVAVYAQQDEQREELLGEAEVPQDSAQGSPLVLVARPHSWLRCTRFAVSGEPQPYELAYNAYDALLGAGERERDWTRSALLGISEACFEGSGKRQAKWNVRGTALRICAPKCPELGNMAVFVDGHFVGTVSLWAEAVTPSATVYTLEGLTGERHGVVVAPETERDRIVVDALFVRG